MLFLDFWGDNPFADLDLPFPPVPTMQQVTLKIKKKKDACNNQLRRLKGREKDSQKEIEKLNKEVKELQERQKKIAIEVKELAVALPFDTLLAVQPIAPLIYFDKPARSAVIAQAWRDIVGEGCVALSDTRRKNFEKDFTHNALLDEVEERDDEAVNEKGDDDDA